MFEEECDSGKVKKKKKEKKKEIRQPNPAREWECDALPPPPAPAFQVSMSQTFAMCYRNVTKLECSIREGLANKTFVCWPGESVTGREFGSSSLCFSHLCLIRRGLTGCAMLTPYEGSINPALPVRNGKGNGTGKRETEADSHRREQVGNGGPGRNEAVQTSSGTARDGPQLKHGFSGFGAREAPFPHRTALGFAPG